MQTAKTENRKHILMIATGGTIACCHSDAGLTPLLSSEELLNYVPAAKDFCTITAIQAFNIDSTNMQPRHWLLLSHLIEEHYWEYDGFVICHGTEDRKSTRLNSSH